MLYFYSHSVLNHCYGTVLMHFMGARENLTATESILSLKGKKKLFTVDVHLKTVNI